MLLPEQFSHCDIPSGDLPYYSKFGPWVQKGRGPTKSQSLLHFSFSVRRLKLSGSSEVKAVTLASVSKKSWQGVCHHDFMMISNHYHYDDIDHHDPSFI